jgi:tRNA G18 (ribose-2'-O)-methylase SpoU
MPVYRLTRLEDERLEEYRNIRDAVLLRRHGLFVAEGRLVVERLLEPGAGVSRVRSVLVNDASFAALERRLAGCPDVPVYVCPTEALVATVGFNLHRGCLALAERPSDRDFRHVIAAASLVLVLEGVSDADNVGSAFRNAAALGADAVLLSPACCDPLYRKAIRTSMGSALRVPYARVPAWPEDLAALKTAGFRIVALTPREPAVDLADCARSQPRQKMALLVGAEGPGLSSDAQAVADVCVRIPMRPGVDSLNLATAAGIALYCLSV